MVDQNNNFKVYLDEQKSRYTEDILKDIVEASGFTPDRNKKYKLRDESTASASIYTAPSGNVYINDLGGNSYSPIDFTMEFKSCDLISALNYIAPFVGMDPFNSESTYKVRVPTAEELHKEKLKQEATEKENQQKLIKVDAEKQKNKRNLTPQLLLKGLNELYPCIDTLQGLESIYDNFGYYKEQNLLTVEVPGASIRRKFKKWDNEIVKWFATPGSKRDYIFKKINPSDEYIYLYSGMAEFIALEKMNLSYIGLQADSIGNISKELIKEVGHRTVVILEENDILSEKAKKSGETETSSQKLSRKLINVFDKVKILNMATLAGKDKTDPQNKGFDLRDLVNNVNSFDITKMFLRSGTLSAPTIEKQINSTNNTKIIPYKGKYISNQDEVDIASLKKGVIIAKTGSGKTHSFVNVPGTLILVPRAIQATIKATDKEYTTDALINKINDSGAIITFDKFYGHYKNNEFMLMILRNTIRVVVDEAHMLLSVPSVRYKLIYALDAVFLSGTIEPFFRSDLQHYKFKPEQPSIMYYTYRVKKHTSQDKDGIETVKETLQNGFVPDFKDALYFVDNAAALMANYSQNCIVSQEHKFNCMEIEDDYIKDYSGGKVITTSCSREGVSVKNEPIEAVIIDSGSTSLWSNKDIIQGLHRLRNDNVKRIVTKKIINADEKNLTIEHFLNIAKEIQEDKTINSVNGELFSKFMRNAFKTSHYEKPSEYGIACYLHDLTKNHYDEDLYRFEPYTDEFRPFRINLDKSPGSESAKEAANYIMINSEKIYYPMLPAQNKITMTKWKSLYESGAVARIAKFKKPTLLRDIYTSSNYAKGIKSQYNKFNEYKEARSGKKKQFTIYHLLRILKSACTIKITDSQGNEIQRVNSNNIGTVYIQVISNCPLSESIAEMNDLASDNSISNKDTKIPSTTPIIGNYEELICPDKNPVNNQQENTLKESEINPLIYEDYHKREPEFTAEQLSQF